MILIVPLLCSILPYSFASSSPDSSPIVSPHPIIPLLINRQITIEPHTEIPEPPEPLDLLAAILVAHIGNYDPQKFKSELSNALNNNAIKSILSQYGGADLVEEFREKGLFECLANSLSWVFPIILSSMEHFIIDFLHSSEDKHMLGRFVSSIQSLRKVQRIEELGPIIIDCLLGREFNKALGNEIIAGQDGDIFREWANQFLGLQYPDEPHSLQTMREELMLRIEETCFKIKKRSDLFRVIKLPTKKLVSFATRYERALFVMAIILLRTKFNIEITGGESNEFPSQFSIIESSNNNFFSLFLGLEVIPSSKPMKTRELLMISTFDPEEFFLENGIGSNVNLFTVRSLYVILKYAIVNFDLGGKIEEDNHIDLVRQIQAEHSPGLLVMSFLETVRYSEIDAIFDPIFDQFFESENGKTETLFAISTILKSVRYIPNEQRVLQLLNCIQYKILALEAPPEWHLHIELLPPNLHRNVEDRLIEAYKKYVPDKKPELPKVEYPKISHNSEKLNISILRLSSFVFDSFKEFEIDEKGRVVVKPFSLAYYSTATFHGNLFNLHATKSGYFLISFSLSDDKFEKIVAIFPGNAEFDSVNNLKTAMLQHILVQCASKLGVFLNMVEFYLGAVFMIEKQIA